MPDTRRDGSVRHSVTVQQRAADIAGILVPLQHRQITELAVFEHLGAFLPRKHQMLRKKGSPLHSDNMEIIGTRRHKMVGAKGTPRHGNNMNTVGNPLNGERRRFLCRRRFRFLRHRNGRNFDTGLIHRID